MLFRDRPLLPDGIDAGLYLERPELERSVLKPLLGERNTLLLGEPGSGKTTLMRRVESRLREHGRLVAWVNAAVANHAEDLLPEINRALGKVAVSRANASSDANGWDGRDGSNDLLSLARRLSRHEPTVIIVDGLLDVGVGFDVFGRLRDELWRSGHTWLVAVRPRDSAGLRVPPADAFWGAVVEIPPLDLGETERLLRLGLEDDEFAAFDRDRPVSGAYPRWLIRDAESRLTGDQPAVDVNELTARAGRLGRSEKMAMTELIGLGRPASAHDPDLLDRLGWSRPYAQRILSRLEADGLLQAIPDRSGERPGRPRKLYQPRGARL